MRILYWPERGPDDRLVKALAELRHIVEPVHGFEDAVALARMGDCETILCDLRVAAAERVAALRAAAPRAWLIVLGGPELGEHRIAALRAGADAVFPRPFEFRELSAKLDAMARRSVRAGSDGKGDLRFDLAPAERAVFINGEPVRLSHREYGLAALLAGRPGEVISLQEILQAVWGDAEDPRPEIVHTYVSRLRAKLERGRSFKLIHVVRGHGYRFNIEA
jgi:two-component system, OmpR family, response regulator